MIFSLKSKKKHENKQKKINIILRKKFFRFSFNKRDLKKTKPKEQKSVL